ncbi:MAG: hypothetical protein U0R24_04075 [Solirubrobacterales bacterium]
MNVCRIEGGDGQPITSLEDWREVGAPAGGDRHWVDSRSAKELAKAWLSGDAASRVIALLSLWPELAGLRLNRAIAEKKTAFDDIPRGPRNHDLLVIGETAAEPLVIGVEGKADEPFDRKLGEWQAAALARTPNSEAPRRLERLTKLFFDTTLSEDSGDPPLARLGYQLVSALAGTLADAKAVGAARAVLLVQEFCTELTDPNKQHENQAAFDAFIQRLARADLSRKASGDGWVTAAVEVSGDGEFLPDLTRVHLAKLTTDVAAT